jgi:hypothetical protein
MNAHPAKAARRQGPVPAELLRAAVSVWAQVRFGRVASPRRPRKARRAVPTSELGIQRQNLICAVSVLSVTSVVDSLRFETVKTPFWRLCSQPIIGLNRSKSGLRGANRSNEYCFDEPFFQATRYPSFVSRHFAPGTCQRACFNLFSSIHLWKMWCGSARAPVGRGLQGSKPADAGHACWLGASPPPVCGQGAGVRKPQVDVKQKGTPFPLPTAWGEGTRSFDARVCCDKARCAPAKIFGMDMPGIFRYFD